MRHDSRERGQEVIRVLRSEPGVLLKAPQHGLLQLHWNAGAESRRGRHVSRLDLFDDGSARTNKWKLPREAFVQHDAHTPDVAAFVGRHAPCLLGAHVADRA